MGTCVFCNIVKGLSPAAKVYEDERVLAFFTIGPVADFHTLVIPKRHSENIFDINAEDWRAVSDAVCRISGAFQTHLGVTDLQIISSHGASAQQDVFHTHVHIVPRAANDGQNVNWTVDPTINDRFDALLARVQDIPELR